MGPEIYISVAALAISGYSFYLTFRSKKAQNKAEAIRQAWDEFTEIDALRLQHPALAHILELPEYFDETKRRVQKLVNEISPEEKSALSLQERAIARRIYSFYEQFIYERTHAHRSGFKDQVEFLDVALANISGRLLHNPRLAYFWSRDDGYSVRAYFEEPTHAHYKTHVAPKIQNYDERGLFDPHE